MSMVNEAEAVNAQRDAHMVGGSVLERRVRSLEEMRRGWSPESGGWGGADRDAGRIAELERQRDAAMELLADARAEAARHASRLIVACKERDSAEFSAQVATDLALERIAALERQRDELKGLLEESREAARAEAARHAGRLIVACEERDVAYAQRDLWQAIVSQAARRTLRGRIGSWLRGKAGR